VWRRLVNRPQSEAELEALRRSVRRGQPFGSPARTMTAEIGAIRRSTEQRKIRQGGFFDLTTRGLMGDPFPVPAPSPGLVGRAIACTPRSRCRQREFPKNSSEKSKRL